jgi:hypothetical protein
MLANTLRGRRHRSVKESYILRQLTNLPVLSLSITNTPRFSNGSAKGTFITLRDIGGTARKAVFTNFLHPEELPRISVIADDEQIR